MKSDQEPITGDDSGGCVLWINFDERTMELGPFYLVRRASGSADTRPGHPKAGSYEGRRSDRRASYVVVNEETKEARAVTFDGLGSLIGIDIFSSLTQAVKIRQNFDAGFVSSLELTIYCSLSLNGLRHRGHSHRARGVDSEAGS